MFAVAFQTHNENLVLKFQMDVLKFLNLSCNGYLLVLQINLVYFTVFWTTWYSINAQASCALKFIIFHLLSCIMESCWFGEFSNVTMLLCYLCFWTEEEGGGCGGGGKSMARISISFNRKLDGSLKLVIMSKVNS